MHIKNIHKKEFSELSSMQKQETIDYNIVENIANDKIFYGIEIISYNKLSRVKDSFFNISDSKKFVMDLICYLYENAVKISTCKDIIDDILSSQNNYVRSSSVS